MCKEMPVIPVNRVVDTKRIIGKKCGVQEEERHKGSLTPPHPTQKKCLNCLLNEINKAFMYILKSNCNFF
jgi:hypothetical protein